MSQRRGGWYKRPPKRPAPERGIKMKKSGATWWGRRWIEALERMSWDYSNRLSRGRTYARAGRTHDLAVKAGRVTAKVTGSRSAPYKVSMRLSKLSAAVWAAAIEAMAREARYSADLLAGQMPQEIDAAFKTAGTSLFPTGKRDLVTECSCPDWANPCKHIAATHYVLGEALDRDPFLLFELRGRTKAQVLEGLRAARGGIASHGSSRAKSAPSAGTGEVPAVALGRIKADAYDRPRVPLPKLDLRFNAASEGFPVLSSLGEPNGWQERSTPVEIFRPLIRDAAAAARSMAMADTEEDGLGSPRDDPADRSRRRGPRKAKTRKTKPKAKAKAKAKSPQTNRRQ